MIYRFYLFSSLDDVTKNMNGLSRLQHLTLRENPIAKKDGRHYKFNLLSFFFN